MPPDPDAPGLGAPPLGPSAPATVEGAVGRMEVTVAFAFAVVVAFPAELPEILAEPEMLPDPVADPLPEADPD
jgi:hypothetical protein